jgi:quinol monooxygenase YgiN
MESVLSQGGGELMSPITVLRNLELGSYAMYRTAEFQVDPNSIAKCRKVIQEFVAYVKSNEPGTLLYISLQNEKDATRFLHLMAFADPLALVEHGSSAANKEFITALYPELESGVVISDFILVAST